MKKRVVCVLLCGVMLFTGAVFGGCASNSGSNSTGDATSDTSKDNTNTERSSMTLSLWVPTSADTTKEAISAVEEAINQLTQAEYDTAIKLYAIPENEYDAKVKEHIETITTRRKEEDQAAIDKRKQEIADAQNGISAEATVADTTAAADAKTDGEYSLVVPSAEGYANIEKNQMDIFLIHGTSDYDYYANNYYIESLNEELSGNAKILLSYIYPDFLTAAEIDGSVYGIPNNHAIGKYTYFLVNKRLVAEEYLDPTQLTSIGACEQFISDIVNYHKDVTPIWGNWDPTYYRFWSSDTTMKTFSVLSSRVTYQSDIDSLELRNIFGYSNYTNNIYLNKLYNEQGYVSTASENEIGEFGVGFVTCTAEEVQKYADQYYINAYLRPEGTRSDYLSSLFAVSTYTKSVSRSMEIITMLNTNTELRTVLQYGVEGVHWKKDELNNNIIVKLSDDYKMNMKDTGNAYVTYPDYGVSMDYWEHSKQQNLDSYLPVTYQFESQFRNDNTANLFSQLDSFSAGIKSRIDAMSASEFQSSIESLRNEVDQNDAFQKLTYIPSENDSRLGKTEEKGWYANGSIAYLWDEYVAEIKDAK